MKTMLLIAVVAVLATAGLGCKNGSSKQTENTQKKVTDMNEKKPDTPKETSPAPEKVVSEYDQIRAALLKNITDKEAHSKLMAWLKKQEKPDKTEIANQQIIIDAIDKKFRKDFRLASLGAVLNHQAWHFIENNRRFDIADVMVRKGLELDGDECDYLDTLAELQFRKGEYKEAIATIKKALAQKDPEFVGMVNSAKEMVRNQKFNTALDLLNSARDKFPQYPETETYIAKVKEAAENSAIKVILEIAFDLSQ